MPESVSTTGGGAETAWVDECLLAGPADDICLRLGAPLTRAELRELVTARAAELAAAGLGAGGSISLRLPPSLAYVVNLLAAWRVGAQVSLLDHRLTGYEVDQATDRIAPQFLVSADVRTGAVLRGYAEVGTVTERLDGRPAATGHALLQLSSGSTGPSKVIGRTAADLVAELDRYRRLDGFPRQGERVVLLASMVHVLGLVGGLLYGLNAGVELVLPEFLTSSAVVAAVAAGTRPTTIVGVPFHIGLLAAADPPPRLPQLARMIVGGELVRPQVWQAFTDRYGVPLGVMYGMTEVGVIATDLSGRHLPALAPVSGMVLREEAGQLLISRPASPYVGLIDPTRWVDGWLHTRDAGTVDEATGLIRVLGRLDSQVSVGGLKVDLTEVEQTLADLPAVREAVVVHDGVIRAYLAVDPSLGTDDAVAGIESELAVRLAAYKRPRHLTVLPKLPRTSSGKLVRDRRALAAAATGEGAAPLESAPR